MKLSNKLTELQQQFSNIEVIPELLQVKDSEGEVTGHVPLAKVVMVLVEHVKTLSKSVESLQRAVKVPTKADPKVSKGVAGGRNRKSRKKA